MTPGYSPNNEQIDKFCLLIGEEFVPFDDVYMLVLNLPKSISKPVLLTNEVTYLLVDDYMPFYKEVLAQIMRKALTRVSRYQANISMFSIIPCRTVVFTAHAELVGKTEYVIIDTVKKRPATKGVN